MALRLNGSTSGYTTLDAPAVAGSNTLVLPTGNGSADQALVTNGSGTLSFADRGRMVLETSQATTSGTFKDFTGIPSWVKRVTVMFNEVSSNGSSNRLIQLGTGSSVFTTSGYLSTSSAVAGTVATTSSTAGFVFLTDNAAFVNSGHVVITNISGNIWVESGVLKDATTQMCFGAGSVSLSAPLTAVRVTSANGTDTFDAGSINILYEG
jgi:hypothetical protein